MRKAGIVVLLAVVLSFVGCASGLDPDLMLAQVKPLADYAVKMADAHEQDEMKKEDVKALAARVLANIEKAKGGDR